MGGFEMIVGFVTGLFAIFQIVESIYKADGRLIVLFIIVTAVLFYIGKIYLSAAKQSQVSDVSANASTPKGSTPTGKNYKGRDLYEGRNGGTFYMTKGGNKVYV